MKRLLILLCFLISGCIEPGRVVQGEFIVNGSPKPGVEVRLPDDLEDFSNCTNAPLSAVTDQSGNFTTTTKKFPVRPCFTVDGRIYSDSLIVDDGREEPIKLRCSLPLVVSEHFENGHVCY